MRLTRWFLPLLLGLTIGQGVPRALAQSAVAAESCQQDPECTRLANQASELSAMGLLNDAQRVYAAAYQRRGDPKLLYERGRVLHKLGRFIDAVVCYRQFLEQGAGGNEKQRHKTEQYMDEALGQAQDAPPAPPQAAPVPAAPPVPALAVPEPAPAPLVLPAAAPAPAIVQVKAPPPPPKKAGPPPPPKKIWQQWWFWTAIGGGAAAVGVGLGVGLGLASRRPDLTGVAEFRPFGN